jgi:hypothetical protein
MERTRSAAKDLGETPEFVEVPGKIKFSIDEDDVTIRIDMTQLNYESVAPDAEFDENETYLVEMDGDYLVSEDEGFREGVTYYVLRAATPGYYRATVINKLNGDMRETPVIPPCRVTNPPVIPANFEIRTILSTGGIADPETHNPNISDGDSIQVTHDDMTPEQTDGLIYEWYFMKGTSPEDNIPDELIPGASGMTYKPTKEGNYYVKLINKFNEATVEKISNVIGFGA